MSERVRLSVELVTGTGAGVGSTEATGGGVLVAKRAEVLFAMNALNAPVVRLAPETVSTLSPLTAFHTTVLDIFSANPFCMNWLVESVARGMAEAAVITPSFAVTLIFIYSFPAGLW